MIGAAFQSQETMSSKLAALVLSAAAGAAFAQTAPAPAPTAPAGPPRIDERVLQIPQSTPGTQWSFIGYSVKTPAEAQWFVASGNPRGGVMGRQVVQVQEGTAVLVFSSEALSQPVETDDLLLALARERHGRIGERWTVNHHDETLVRHAGTRCSRHTIEAREPEDKSPRKNAAEANAERTWLHVLGMTCIHPTDPNLLVEVGASERSINSKMNTIVAREAEATIKGLAFQRFSEKAMQKSAEAARTGALADAEAALKPYVEADAAWARFFLAQIIGRATPLPDNAGPRIKDLLEPAATRGLADAQWMLGSLLLRGMPGVARNPKAAEPWLRQAAERGNAGAEFQLGISLLSDKDGLSARPQEGALWIQRAAARGLKEAQELLKSGPNQASPPAGPAVPGSQAVPSPAPNRK